MDVLIIRQGAMLAVSPDGRSPCPDDIVNRLAPFMVYTHKKFLRGRDAYDPVTGERTPMRFERRAFYFQDGAGRFVCNAGFLPRIVRVLSDAGYRLKMVDMSPERPRPDCYTPDWSNVDSRIQWRPRQRECLEAIAASDVGGVVDAVMAFGKTFIQLGVALLYPHAKIDITAKSKDVALKTHRFLTRYMPTGIVGAGRRDKRRVTVYVAASLHHSDGDADFLLGDEVHELLANSYVESINRRHHRARRFGFTGTTEGRSDGTDARLEAMFGPTIFRLTYQEAQRLGLVVPIQVNWLPLRMTKNPIGKYVDDTAIARHGLWRNAARNQLIADFAKTIPDDVQTLILVSKIEHAVYLRQLLPSYQLCYGNMDKDQMAEFKSLGLLPAEYLPITPDSRERMRGDFEDGRLKKVIATDVWATGVDFPQLEELIRADGRASSILAGQGPGRVSRICPDINKGYGRVTDVADFFDDRLCDRSRRRYRAYAKYGWSQTWPNALRTEVAGG